MTQRHKDAHAIQTHGACNISGIAHSLIAACREVHSEGGSTREDPAVRLIVHQIAHLANCYEIDKLNDAYPNLMRICEEKAKEDEATSIKQDNTNSSLPSA